MSSMVSLCQRSGGVPGDILTADDLANVKANVDLTWSVVLTPATLTGGKFVWSNGEEVTASGVFKNGTTFIDAFTGYGPYVMMDSTYKLLRCTQVSKYIPFPVLCKKI
ncbi:uncharacterized protein LOC125179089 [Hyalella azteca]|uniref:Uncharacterized protein LOC125179089 n=1 Tax=Hyalella azteca TaxID=294128 RepID=A0A979FSQ4_HYAAZ|nr:uncharacterized protein LOC125179089 [Hyalella azteca]